MSASDNVNQTQFPQPESSVQMFPISKIGSMQSVNLKAVGKSGTVDDWYQDYRAGHGTHPSDERMAKHGNSKERPISVGLANTPDNVDVLYDGHHRYASARDNGVTHLPAEVEGSPYTATSWGS